MPNNKKSSIVSKLVVAGGDDGDDVLSRLCDLYYSRPSGKTSLLTDLLAGGMILKETGLLDLIVNIDCDPEYRDSDNLKKSRMLRDELRQVFGLANESESVTVSRKGNDEQPQEPQKKPDVIKAVIPNLGA